MPRGMNKEQLLFYIIMYTVYINNAFREYVKYYIIVYYYVGIYNGSQFKKAFSKSS